MRLKLLIYRDVVQESLAMLEGFDDFERFKEKLIESQIEMDETLRSALIENLKGDLMKDLVEDVLKG